MRKKILVVALVAVIAAVIILAVVLPWTMMVWTPIYMPGVQTSAGFSGKLVIVWSTAVIVAAGVVLASVLLYSFKKGAKKGGNRMKKMLIIFMIVVAISVIGEMILPRLITQTFEPICSLPGATVTFPHWLFERWIPRYNTGLAIILGIITAYTLLRRGKAVKG